MKILKHWIRTPLLASICIAAMVSNANEEDVKELVATMMGSDNQVVNVKAAEIEGFFEVLTQDLTILYVSDDLRWVIIGELVEAIHDPELQFVRLGEQTRNAVRERQLNAIDETDVIAFAPPFEKPKAVVHVFTDTTCGYCQKLHAELPEYHGKGIEIRYLAYPRAGIGSEPYKQMAAAWCSDNPHVAITQLKRGGTLEETECNNPVAGQYRLGQFMGLRGTPLLVLSNGKTVGGYVNAEELETILQDEGLL
ncbi:MAG: DsbC family protein [Gammaproteobacteria bacterium]|nr:DsbC family protein [Gammaproteobacteria bacterium]